MTHRVQIRVPQNIQNEAVSGENWFKQTTKTDGVKTTTLFQRENKPRSLGQKIIDFFSGIKKAKDSVTLTEAFKCINKNTELGGKFNENLIPRAIEQMRSRPAEDMLDSPKAATSLSSGKYTLSLDE